MNHRVDGLTLVALALISFMGFNVLRDRVRTAQAASQPAPQPAEKPALPQAGSLSDAQAAWSEAEQLAVAAPYEHYTLTQGLRGYSYGQMAIDLAAGKGAEIRSPIDGVVTQRYTDQYGNPTLVIENDFYTVTLLHGKFTASVGDRLTLGQPVGTESNQGYTTDSRGRLCQGRKGCGYHTHLNIFDKRLQSNVNPLDLIGASAP
jgi:murein DD-endopeptidase MepM/ murein hydrolase activator NlpD